MSDYELRPASSAGRDFFCALFATTRDYEMALVPWPDEMKRAFLEQQFEAQWSHYSQHYADARHEVVWVGGEPVGRIMVLRVKGALRIVDFALLPKLRRLGVGRRIIEAVQREAAGQGLGVTGCVEYMNPARLFWQALGFSFTTDNGIYQEIEWRPAG